MGSSVWRCEQGAALIEAALVLPILLLLLLGVMELSLYFWTSGLATKAVQLGARQAAVSSAVAVGPGLDPAESEHYWDGLPPGASCEAQAGSRGGLCPSFSVVCAVATGCQCHEGSCGFRFSSRRLAPILTAMRAVMPELTAENVEVAYATNGFGYVARPVPVPVDVRVTLLGVNYRPLFLADLFGASLPLRASAELPGEALVTR